MRLHPEPIRIQHSGHQHMDALGQLYLASFPKQERRILDQLRQLLPEQDMHIHAWMLDGAVAGLSIHWPFEDFLFLEHLAIVPALRGQKLGHQVVQWLLEQAKGPLVLETECSTDEASRRRIAFYERQGLVLHTSFAYRQPPYRKGGSPVPMHLMTGKIPVAASGLHNIAATIRQRVYERFYT
ncbi:GNAT family N-acetyltransferase [Pontibacter sp. 172403-2]|uniref:GNAT family N-acetyltransferase n=1 Tax=Pontibacter rufus TaxID=2791028 RepID=UPI0018AF6FD4|nr:GNAT family N-acetyltransferase [Pontibacter sp. 172403-2]MBF9254437.1 GNAT family N-acetyltransferase [Pontibacter sp. 172403-2]